MPTKCAYLAAAIPLSGPKYFNMQISHQQPGSSLFPEIEWSRPENKALAGNLLIIGGNLHAISAPVEAFKYTQQEGAGSIRVFLPEATKKILPVSLPNIEFASSNPSGSFSKKATNILAGFVAASDAVLFCGDLGKNSETAIVLEELAKQPKLMVFTKDSLGYFLHSPSVLLSRSSTIIVASLAELQKIAKNSHFDQPFLFEDGQVQLTNKLASFSSKHEVILITERNGVIFLTYKGRVLETNFKKSFTKWRLELASKVAVWAMQNQNNQFEACATAIAKLSS